MQDVVRKAGGKLKEVGLCTAAAAGDLDMIKLMCDNGADINVVNGIGRTMLHLACSNKQPSIIEYLMTFDHLDYNIVDWFGGTPLDDAHREGHESIAVTITEAGGLSAAHPSLKERIAAMDKKKEAAKEKATLTREKNTKLDAIRKTVLSKVTVCGQIAVVDMAYLRRLWDALSLSLNGTTWRKQQALEKAPRPSLDEILKFFRFNFAAYMQEQYAMNNLKCYEVLVCFEEMVNDGVTLRGGGKFAKAVGIIVDE
jgi:hypothetical protein